MPALNWLVSRAVTIKKMNDDRHQVATERESESQFYLACRQCTTVSRHYNCCQVDEGTDDRKISVVSS
jgi:hypothetical protein